MGVWAPEGEKALLNSREAGVGGVEASKTRQPWPIVTTGTMAIRSHGPAAQTKRSAQVPADPGCRWLLLLQIPDPHLLSRSVSALSAFRLKMGKLRSRCGVRVGP